MTEIFFHPDNDHVVHQGLTAVLKGYQGRGLGKLLKGQIMIHIKEHYRNVKFIRTVNADKNVAMLAINTKMGFKYYKSNLKYKFTIDELVTKFLD